MKKLLILFIAAVGAMGLRAATLDDANKAIEAEKFDNARGILEGLVKSNPDDGEYAFNLGNLYLTIGEDALAKTTFESGMTAKKNANLNLIGLGQIALNEGRKDDAVAKFNQATAGMKKKDTREFLYIARAYLNSFNPDYQQALAYAQKVVGIDPSSAQGFLTLGDAQLKLKNLNEAANAYRTAANLDPTLLRAKLDQVIMWDFPEAEQGLKGITQTNPDYGPAYRELADVYYRWALADDSVYKQKIDQALAAYEKYMSLTDHSSLDARMRHADFLVLAKQYAALEKEATEMQKIDKVNPRILRYLGYSAFEDGNFQESIDALTKFIGLVEPHRVLGLDYLYMARSQARILFNSDAASVDTARISSMNSWFLSAVGKDSLLTDYAEIRDLGMKFYKAKDYDNAARVFGTLMQAPSVDVNDKLLFARSILYNAAKIGQDDNKDALLAAYQPQMLKADTVYGELIAGLPTMQSLYYQRAGLNYYITGPEAEARRDKYYREFIRVTSDKGDEELSKPATRNDISNAYTALGSIYFDKDQQQALDFFNKALEFNPDNTMAQEGVKALQSKKK